MGCRPVERAIYTDPCGGKKEGCVIVKRYNNGWVDVLLDSWDEKTLPEESVLFRTRQEYLK